MGDNEFWNARRQKLEQDVIKATLGLFEHMGSAGAFCLPLDDNKKLFVMAGDGKSLGSFSAGLVSPECSHQWEWMPEVKSGAPEAWRCTDCGETDPQIRNPPP